MSGRKFLKESQVTDKLLSEFFPLYIHPFTNDSNSKIIALWVSKIYEWI